ncbi:MAG TPA: hypothetical protein PKK26_08230 [Candidatus Wallbacteria bacterium]|nr:hypothetical protein [Candidatus Wallbacteria bacterium]
MDKKDFVLYHGDFDGIVSAALLIQKFSLSNYFISSAEPFTVDRVMKRMRMDGSCARTVYMVDLAPNNKSMKMTKKFVEDCSGFAGSVKIYDHHSGWENFSFGGSVELIVANGSPSCARHLYNTFEYSEMSSPVMEALASDADIIDTGGYEGVSAAGTLIYRALKSDMKAPGPKAVAIDYILSGLRDEPARRTLCEMASGYDAVLSNSFALLAECRELRPGICYLNVDDAHCDITVIIAECYKKFQTVIIEYFSGCNRFYIIATSGSELNMLEKLGIHSGSRHRVTIVKCDLEQLLAKLQ